MADNRDFRVRAFLYIVNEGVATGLYDHVLDVKDEAGFVSLEKCGHRIGVPCEIVERYDVI